MPINGSSCNNSKANIDDTQPNGGFIMGKHYMLEHHLILNIVHCAFSTNFNVSTAFAMREYLTISELVRATIISFAFYLSIVCLMFSMKEHTQTMFSFDSLNPAKFVFFLLAKKLWFWLNQIFLTEFTETKSKME